MDKDKHIIDSELFFQALVGTIGLVKAKEILEYYFELEKAIEEQKKEPS